MTKTVFIQESVLVVDKIIGVDIRMNDDDDPTQGGSLTVSVFGDSWKFIYDDVRDAKKDMEKIISALESN